MRPIVLANCAITADGKAAIARPATASRSQPTSFTSKQDRRRLLEIRAEGDAILVGHQTLKIDNPPMSIPAADLRQARLDRGVPEYPMRIVISASGEISPELAIFHHPVAPTIVYSTIRMPPHIREQLKTKATLHLTDAQRVDL
ncbi:MAG: dihydrofolate reductase family protein, partial [Verrucomicrobia bacterium]|nr:dihydrofolate reductase family protein [Verrucomicrobiota bacterium]